MTLEDIDKELQKKKIQFDSSINYDGKIFYFHKGLLVAEVAVSMERQGIFGNNIMIDIFETRNKLREKND